MVEVRNLELQRNASETWPFQVLDSTGAALDVTGNTFKLEVKARAGDPDPPLAAATITVTSAAQGLVDAYLAGSSFNAVSGTKEIVRLAYDLIVTRAGKDIVLARGTLSLIPGVS